MPDIEAKNVDSKRNSGLFRKPYANPLSSLALMNSSSDLP
jgi:hypothetical protein